MPYRDFRFVGDLILNMLMFVVLLIVGAALLVLAAFLWWFVAMFTLVLGGLQYITKRLTVLTRKKV